MWGLGWLLLLLACADAKDSLLAQLLSPTLLPQFWSRYHESKPLHCRDPANAGMIRALLRPEDLDTYLWAHKPRLEEALGADVELARGGFKLFKDGMVPLDYHQLYQEYHTGATLIVHAMEQHPSLYRLVAALEGEFGVPISINAYASPATAHPTPGFHYHYDGHDSLIAATAGVKIWTVCDPDWEFARSAVVQTIVGMGLSCQNITLQAGDTLYIPEGSYHKAWPTSSGLASLHLTIAIDTSMQSWQRFLLLVLERGSEAPCDGLAEHIEEAVATKQYHWRKTGPFASSTAMRMSVHNNDLPKGYIERIVVPAVSQEIAVLLSKQHSTECVTAVGSKLLRLPESLRHAVGEALDTLRPVSYTHLTLPTKRIV
eukprot:TRINITY_DN13866_c0_g2_i4.p1 TRINITY_DN13866_c0_g2~~TRINITY_DN13866_c0_g2_i4.p1  ORF type:complete len:373 (-),score=55.08 TRINITY_DN13866_c0_g2_i4:111-1229(-)